MTPPVLWFAWYPVFVWDTMNYTWLRRVWYRKESGFGYAYYRRDPRL